MKDLPKVFQNNFDKKFQNNSSVFYSRSNFSKEEKLDTRSIKQKINDIFSSPNYVYKANVEITLKDKQITKRIIGRNKDYIITMDNSIIPINDIIDIKSIKK